MLERAEWQAFFKIRSETFEKQSKAIQAKAEKPKGKRDAVSGVDLDPPTMGTKGKRR